MLGRKIRACYLELCHVRAALKAVLASREDTRKFITDLIGSGMGILAKTQDCYIGCQGGDQSMFLQVSLHGMISVTFGRSLPGSSFLKRVCTRNHCTISPTKLSKSRDCRPGFKSRSKQNYASKSILLVKKFYINLFWCILKQGSRSPFPSIILFLEKSFKTWTVISFVFN